MAGPVGACPKPWGRGRSRGGVAGHVGHGRPCGAKSAPWRLDGPVGVWPAPWGRGRPRWAWPDP